MSSREQNQEAFLQLAPFATLDEAYDAHLEDRATRERHCSICDAIGHGYPGGGPCPLEDSGYRNEPTDSELYFRGIIA